VRERDVLLGDGAGVVRDERDRDAVPDVRPVGVVIAPLGRERHSRHEREGLGEVRELELARELAAHDRPARELRQGILELLLAELARSGHRGRASHLAGGQSTSYGGTRFGDSGRRSE